MEKHIPVLLNEVIEGLNINPDGIYVDLTLGRAGHSSEILKRLSPKGLLIGFDQDETALKESKPRLEKIGSNFILVSLNFRNVKEELTKLNISEVDGFLFDLGVSSPQFDDLERGFSYKARAVLDMRMNQNQNLTAKTVINTYSLHDLIRVFRDYGEDKYSYQIAKRIEKVRQDHEIVYTDELVEIIKASKPMKELNKKGHPAKQIFQALRIEVNDEYGCLNDGLTQALSMLKSKGRIAVITFHSGEDRIVKNIFKNLTTIEGTRKNVFKLDQESCEFTLVNKKVILPSESELEINNRSHSAKLRIIEKN